MNQEALWFFLILFVPLIPLKILAHQKRKQYLQSDQAIQDMFGMSRAALNKLLDNNKEPGQ